MKSADGTTLQMVQGGGGGGGGGGGRRNAPARPAVPPAIGVAKPPSHLWLRVHCNFDTDQAIFSWSNNGREFTPVGNPFTMTFQLTTFQGVRPALFNFNTSGAAGGYADFDNFTVLEPRARGVEREIPAGKTITMTSGADGSVLAADTQTMSLVNIAADQATGAPPASARFEVIDLRKGRVALKAQNGRYLSANENGVALKDLAGAAPAEAESFQWVNLLRGDTMLMSLTNHRYLGTQPGSPGRVTVSATGPRADRKDGGWTLDFTPHPPDPPGLAACAVGTAPHSGQRSGVARRS